MTRHAAASVGALCGALPGKLVGIDGPLGEMREKLPGVPLVRKSRAWLCRLSKEWGVDEGEQAISLSP